MGMEQVSMKSLHSVATSSGDTGNLSTSWSWSKKDVGIWGQDHFSTHGLLEHLNTILDKSDYLWYTIRYDICSYKDYNRVLEYNFNLVISIGTYGELLHFEDM